MTRPDEIAAPGLIPSIRGRIKKIDDLLHDLAPKEPNADEAHGEIHELAYEFEQVVPACLSATSQDDAVREAYIAGATAVHNEWIAAAERGDEPPRGEPDFSEAASDYAALAPAEKAGDQGQACLDMLILCGELDGKQQGETYPQYLRRLIDAVVAITTPPSGDVAKVEKRAKEIYDGFAYEGPGNKPAWVNGGNSSKQNDARALAQAETKYDDGEAPWTEDEQFAEQQNACIGRRKKYGQRHCDEKDGSCTECEHDAQVMLRRKYLIQSAAPGGGTKGGEA